MVQTIKRHSFEAFNTVLLPNRLPRTAFTGRELINIAIVVGSALQVEVRQQGNYCGTAIAMVDCTLVQMTGK
jgi:hypothetical protein